MFAFVLFHFIKSVKCRASSQKKMRFTSLICALLLHVCQQARRVSSFTAGSSSSIRSQSTALSMSEDGGNRVVVTGLGVVSGCGIGADDFFQALLDGKSSIDTVKRFDISNSFPNFQGN